MQATEIQSARVENVNNKQQCRCQPLSPEIGKLEHHTHKLLAQQQQQQQQKQQHAAEAAAG